MTRPLGPLTDEERDTFLTALREGSTAKDAAKEAGRDRQRFYLFRDNDEDFAAEWKQAWAEGTDVLEQEARRRAVEGTIERERYSDTGQLLERTRKYSDTLLIFLLKSRDPARFNRFEITGAGGGPVGVNVNVDADSAARVLAGLVEAGLVQPGHAATPDPEGQ